MSKNKKIFLRPHSGLGNRFRVLVSGIELSKLLNAKLIILWTRDDSLNANYFKLFEKSVSTNFLVIQSNLISKLICYTGTKFFYKILSNLVRRLLGIDFILSDNDFPEFVWNGKNELNLNHPKVKLSNNILINTCNQFEQNWSHLKFFAPSLEVKKKLSSLVFSNQYIGMHIRRQDHFALIQMSPISLYIEKIEEEIQLNQNVKIYLSTDDLKIEGLLHGHFSKNIVIRKKCLSRNSEAGIIDALADILILSGSSKLYGSFESSFAVIASTYGNVPLIDLRIHT
jgi:hypothetical protein